MEGITGTETSGPWMPVGLALGGVVSRRELWASRPYPPPRTALISEQFCRSLLDYIWFIVNEAKDSIDKCSC